MKDDKIAPDDECLSYWRRTLLGTAVYGSFPKDRNLISNQVASQSLNCTFEPGLSERVHERASELACSSSEFFLATLFALLFRYTDQCRLVIAVWDRALLTDRTGIGQTLPEKKGPYLAVPTVVDLTSGTTFQELLSRVQSSYRGGRRVGGVLESALPNLIQGDDSTESDTPLPVGFTTPRVNSLPVIPLPREAASQFGETCPGPLSVSVSVTGDQTHLRISYSANRYRREFIETAISYYCKLLDSAVIDPSAAVHALDLTTPKERASQHGWSIGARLPPIAKDLARRLGRHALDMPEKAAVVDTRGSLSYQELDRRSNRLGHYLRDLGVGSNVPVALCLPRSRELVVAYAAIAKAGGAILLIDSTAPLERLTRQLKVVAPAVVIANPQSPAALACGEWLLTSFEIAEEQAQRFSDTPPDLDVSPHDTRLLFATSGSTGQPKIVSWPIGYEIPSDLTSHDRHVLKNESGTTFANAEIAHPLWSGGTIFVAPPGLEKHAAGLARFIAQHRITSLLATPSMLSGLLETDEVRNCQDLRRAQCSGEVVSPALRRRFFEKLQARLIVSYGCTEAAGATSRAMTPAESDNDIVDVGRTSPGMEVFVLDSGRRPCPVDIPGEIFIGGQIARGYLSDNASTSELFVAHPLTSNPDARLFRTGDLGRWLSNGTLQVLGRRDGWVKLGGYRIELGEIERALSQHSGIRQSVVQLFEDPPRRPRLVGYLVAEFDQRPLPGELRSFLSRVLPPYMWPSAFVFLDAMPTNSNGKVNRQSLPAPENSRPELATPYLAPRNRIEEQIAAIWCELLPVDRVGVHDDFLDLGGESILAFQVYARIETLFGRRLPLDELFERGTVSRLASLLADADSSSSAPDAAAQADRDTGNAETL